MFDSETAALLALIKRKCPWCERELRPCNLDRHIAKEHFRQLTIDEALHDVEAET